MDAIQIENVSKVYRIGTVETHALNDISLSIGEGEFTALVGPSGSGKTTLLQLIGCLDKPDRGVVKIKGQDVTRFNANQRADLRRDEIGFIFQFFALVPVLTAYENVELPLLLSNVKASERRERVTALLDAVGLADRAKHRPDQMSGGEQQRVAIALALANKPSLLLADEPTGEVDTNTALGIFKVFQDLNRNFGLTTIIVSHDPAIARQVDRVVAIRDGMLASETVRQVRQNGGAASGNGAVGNGAADEGAGGGEVAVHDTFEELVVLDRAGRVHVPQEYLEQYAIKGRARLELVDDGILIRAVEPHGSSAEPVKETEHAEDNDAKEKETNARTPRGKGAKRKFPWFS